MSIVVCKECFIFLWCEVHAYLNDVRIVSIVCFRSECIDWHSVGHFILLNAFLRNSKLNTYLFMMVRICLLQVPTMEGLAGIYRHPLLFDHKVAIRVFPICIARDEVVSSSCAFVNAMRSHYVFICFFHIIGVSLKVVGRIF